MRSAAVRESMEGPEVRARPPISDAWLDSMDDANLEKRPRGAVGKRRRRGEEEVPRRRRRRRRGIWMHGSCAVWLMAKRRYTMAYVSNHIKQ